MSAEEDAGVREMSVAMNQALGVGERRGRTRQR